MHANDHRSRLDAPLHPAPVSRPALVKNDEAAVESFLPSDNTTPHARPANKPVFALHLVHRNGDPRTFQYAHLDDDCHLVGDRKIVLHFVGRKSWVVTLEGERLARLYDLILQHRMPWVQEIDEMNAATINEGPVVERITVEDESEKKPAAGA
jgi:hypothetical protein